MSTTIEQNVVQMRFENAEFERNIQTSMNSLNNLKGTISNGIITSGLTSSVKTIAGRFSTMGIIGVTALQNITNSAINTGKQLLKSLTITPVKTGLDEYELKMNSIQTILAGARKKNGARVTIDEVKNGLEELNAYADKTIYNFQDMTSNIGKFTNAGVDWETSVAAIQGVANAAALAGSNSQQASHAMYNFSQALSAGYVKMIDWRSIEIAGMATMDFKDQLLKTAIACGTVEKTGSGMYKALTDNNTGKKMKDSIKTAGMFTEGLQYQWLTSEVLTKTLAKYSDETTDVGKRATEAATQIKTFTQLLSVFREEAQSGWAMTWEYIVGDFEQAKKLWTGVNKQVGKLIENQAKQRNKLIQGWAKEGGRQALINTVQNSWNAFLDIAGKIKEAFRDVFPAMTSERLANITKNLEKLTQKFTLSDKASKNLTSTFRGLFSIFGLIKTGIKTILDLISPLTDAIPTLAGNFLEVTGRIGDFLYEVEQSVDKVGLFRDQIDKFKQLFSSKDSGGSFTDKLKNMFKGGGEEAKKSASWMDIIKNKLQNLFPKKKANTSFFDDIIKNITGFIGKIKSMFKAKGGGSFEFISDMIKKAIPTVLKVIKDVGKRLYETTLNSLDIFKLIKFRWDIKNAGLLSGMFGSITKFFDLLTKETKGVRDTNVSKSLVKTLNTLQKVLISFQKNIQAGTLIKIGAAVGIMALSLIALSGLSMDEIGNGVVGLGAILGELLFAFKMINGMSLGKGNGMKDSIKSMRQMAASVFVMAVALENVANLPVENMKNATLALAAMMSMLTMTTIALNESAGKTKGAAPKGLLSISVALVIISKAVENLAKLNPDELSNGLLGVITLVSTLGLFLTLVDFDGMGVGKGVGILLIAEAIKVLSSSVQKLAEIDAGKIGQGLFAVGALLTEIGLFQHIANDSKSMILFATSLVIIAASISILTKSVMSLSQIKPDQLGQGLFGVGALLAEIALFSNLLGDAKNMMTLSTSLGMIASGISKLSDAVIALSGVDPSSLGQGLFAIGALLTEIGLFQTLAGGAEKVIATSVALVIMATGIKTLVGALNDFATTDPNQMGAGLIMMGGALGILVIALNAMNGAIGGALAILIVAAALRVLTPALQALGSMSIGEIITALVTLAATLAVFGAAAALLTPLIIPMLGLSLALAALGGSLVVLTIGLKMFGSVAVVIFNTLAHVFEGVIAKIKGFLEAFASIHESIMSFVGSIAGTIGVFLLNALGDALSNIPGIGDAIGNKLHQAADKLESSITSDGVKSKTKQVKDDAVGELEGMDEKFGEESKKASDKAAQNLDSSKVKTASKEMRSATVDGFKGIDQDVSKEYKKVSEAASKGSKNIDKASKKTTVKVDTKATSAEGSKATDALAKGMKKGEGKVKSAGKKVAQAGASAVSKERSKFVTSGENTGEGIARGISKKRGAVTSAAKGLANAANSAYNSTLNIKSPSRVMMWSGRMTVMGVVKGIVDNMKLAANASMQVADSVRDAMSSRINALSDDIDPYFEYNPVISPVMDLNSVQNGINTIDNSLGLTRTLSLSPEMSYKANAMSGAMQRIQNGSSNADVVSAIGKLRRDIGNIQSNVTNINGVTYDDGSNIHDAVGTLIRAAIVEGRA